MKYLSTRTTLLVVGILIALTTLAQTGAPRIVINSMGHSAKVQNVLFTPDGGRIITVAEDKTVRVWSVTTGDMVKKFATQIGDGPEGMLYASAISPDGKILATSGYTLTPEKKVYITIIDLEKGEQVATAVGHTNIVNSMAFSSNGRYLFSGSDDGSIKVWNAAEGASYNLVTSITVNTPVKHLSINPSTMELAVAAEGRSEVLVYPMAGLEKGVVKFSPKSYKNHKGDVNRVAYSGDGAFLASSSVLKEFTLWKADGSVVKQFEFDDVVNAIAFSHDSKILVGLDVSGKGQSFGVPAGNKFTDFTGHDNAVQACAFSPLENGSYIVASAGGNNNEIYLWNPINGRTIRKIKGKGSAIHDLAFGSTLELFISQEISTKPNQFKRSFDFKLLKLNPSPAAYQAPAKKNNEGLMQISEVILDLPRGKSIQNDPAVDGRILDYLNTPDGFVVVASDYSLKMYDRNGFFQKEFVGHTGGVRSLAITGDGRYLASGSEDQTIILWNLSETGASPSLRQAFPEAAWGNFFSSLPMDSVTSIPSKESWRAVIDFLKANGDKTYKALEDAYKNLGETILPFATLFITEDNEWVCWTHKGYFSCTQSGSQYFGWHINKGVDKLADFYAAEQYFEILYRPKQLEKSISAGKRVEDILREDGERIFDLSRLQRPSAGFFETANLFDQSLVQYEDGKMVTTNKTLPLQVEIFDGGGGVKEVNIFHNDKLIQTDSEVKTSKDNDRVTRTYQVDLVNETNEFKVVVVSFQKVESKPSIIKVEYKGERMATASLHLLAIGINKYKNSTYNLNYAEPDARSFIEHMTKGKLDIFKGVYKTELYNEQATKENIVAALKDLSLKAKPEDVFVFYYAGHGTQDEEVKNADGESPFYFVPTDVTKLYGDPAQLKAKALASSELVSYLTKIRSTKQIVLMDACHSGGAVKDFNVRGAAGDEKALVQLSRSSGTVIIASSGSKQFATEFDVLKHGVFTYALLEALSGKNDNGDKKITANELKLYMEERVPELTKQYGGTAQYPTGRSNGQDFPIFVVGEN